MPPQGQATISAYTPSFWANAYDAIRNSALGYAVESALPGLANAINLHPTATVYSPDYQASRNNLVSPQYLVPTSASNRSRVAATTRGVLGGAGNMTSGANLSTMAGIAATGGLSGMAGLAANAGLMGAGALGIGQQLYHGLGVHYSDPSSFENFGNFLFNAAQMGLGARGFANGLNDLSLQPTANLKFGAVPAVVPNASGESAASLEAINRAASERTQGVKRVRIDTRSGREMPLIGPDAVDATAGPYDVIVKRGPQGEEILDQGAKARPLPSRTPSMPAVVAPQITDPAQLRSASQTLDMGDPVLSQLTAMLRNRPQEMAAKYGTPATVPPPTPPEPVWPENYRQAAQNLSSNNGGGANYTAADLAALKAKYGIKDAPMQMVGAPPSLADQIYAAHNANGGASFSLSRGNMTGQDAFAVGVFPNLSRSLDTISPEAINQFIQDNQSVLSHPNTAVGTWLDQATGKHVLDVSAVTPDLAQARSLGKQFNQKAIFDLKNLNEIPTGGTGEATAGLPDPNAVLKGLNFNPNNLNLSHWSNVADLTETDPAKFGTGKAGAERSRANDPGFLPRTYFGMEGYRESAIQSQNSQYNATVNGSRYYDIANDPEGLWQQGYQQGGPTGAEQALREAGYSGYHHDGVVASFDKVPVNAVPKASGAAAGSGFWGRFGNEKGFATTSALTDGLLDTAFDPSRFDEEEPGPSNILAPFGTTSAKRFKSVVPDKVAQYLTPGWENILKSPISQRGMLDYRKKIASPDEVEAAAQLGQASGFNWYPMSRQLGNVLEGMSGLPEGINNVHFNGALAATSPQTNVPRNLAETLDVMHNIEMERRDANSDPLNDPEAFGNWLRHGAEYDAKGQVAKLNLPYGGHVDVAGSKAPNLERALFNQPLGGLKVSSFWDDLNQGDFGTIDTISQKGLGAGSIFGPNMGKVFQPAHYMGGRSVLAEVAAKHGVSVDQIQAPQWVTSRMINDDKALQTGKPEDVVNEITNRIHSGMPETDMASVALDALNNKHMTDPRYSAWKSDYMRVNDLLTRILKLRGIDIDDFKANLNDQLQPYREERSSRPLGEVSSRQARKVVGRTQRSILAAGADEE